MPTTALKRFDDGSVALPLSQDALDELELGPESLVRCDVRGGMLLVRPESDSVLDRALAEFHLMPRDAEEDKAWVQAPRVGRELI